MSGTPPAPENQDQLAEAVTPFLETIETIIRKEVERAQGQQGVGSDAPTDLALDVVPDLVARAPELFGSQSWKKEIRTQIEEALQSVLPGLIKRFRADMDKRITGGGTGGATDPRALVNSPEMKEALEERFRTMLLYIKQDVIPRALKTAQVSA